LHQANQRKRITKLLVTNTFDGTAGLKPAADRCRKSPRRLGFQCLRALPAPVSRPF